KLYLKSVVGAIGRAGHDEAARRRSRVSDKEIRQRDCLTRIVRVGKRDRRDKLCVNEVIHPRKVLRDVRSQSSCFAARNRSGEGQIVGETKRSPDDRDVLLARQVLISEVVAGRIRGPRDPEVLGRDVKLVEEAVLEDINLVDLILSPQVRPMITDISDLKSRVFCQLSLYAECPR